MDTSATSNASNPNVSSQSQNNMPQATAPNLNFSSHSAASNSVATAGYQELLSTISELQMDLQRTVSLATKLKSENTSARRNYEEIKLALVRTRKRYSELRDLSNSREDEITAKESEIEARMASWRAQVEAESKRFSDLQAKMAPQDLDMLRIELQRELESTHKARLSTMDDEIERWRLMFFKARKEYDLIRTDYEQYQKNSTNDIESAHEQRKSEVASLQRALIKATKDDGKNINEQLAIDVQQLQRRIDEQNIIEEDLRKEIAEVRIEKQKEEVARHDFVSSFQTQIADQLSLIALLEADKEGLNRKVNSLSSENSRLKGSAKEATILCESAQNDAVRARKILTDREKEIIDEKAKVHEEVTKSRRMFELERDELQASIDALRRQKQEAEENVIDISAQLSDAKRNVVLTEDKARREAREQLTILQQQIEKLENDNIRLEDSKKRAAVENASNISRAVRECEAARSDCQRIAREKEAMAVKAASLADKLEVLKATVSENDSHQATADRQVKDLKSKNRKLDNEGTDLKMQNSELTRRLEMANEDVARLSNAMDKLREEHLISLSDMKKTIEKDRQALKDKLKEEVSKYKSKLSKEQKKSQAYKEKALEAHSKTMRARSALSSVASANEMVG
ncbi:hypothetical protein TrRE_jg6645 [Triparma retinervis]|uniref:Uncharacterized protein n=1 Tax=Triparma retinervis TaxID=2557542 RepID=A0A9W7AEK6_9STRA|nr:hypothetical protein TrRE_jg6645 [Triparma retinervis]